MNEDPPPPLEMPVDGVLDLHTFKPGEIGSLVPAYLDECRRRGVLQIRLIHGKGIGNLQRSVHAILSRRSDVIGFRTASALYGGEGATIVTLRPAA
jgi:DNA-nicking Smr family endonuclease